MEVSFPTPLSPDHSFGLLMMGVQMGCEEVNSGSTEVKGG